jgi:hypothetical protein
MAAKTGIAHKAGWLALTATATLLLLSGTAVAQLAVPGYAPVPGTGIPFGATGLTSPGLSPAPMGTIGPTGTGTLCAAAGGASSAMSGTGMSGTGMSGTSMSGTATTYDGGGIAMGSPALANPTICDMSTGSAASSAAMPMSPGSGTRAGIPLDSVEINNLGVSPSAVLPSPGVTPMTTSVLPSATGASMLPPSIMGTSMAPAPTTGASSGCTSTGISLTLPTTAC